MNQVERHQVILLRCRKLPFRKSIRNVVEGENAVNLGSKKKVKETRNLLWCRGARNWLERFSPEIQTKVPQQRSKKPKIPGEREKKEEVIFELRPY